MSISEKLTTIAENQEKVFDAGKEAQEKEFFDDFLYNADSAFSYRFAGAGWTAKTFQPKNKHMNVVGGSSMFFMSAIEVDLVEHLKSLNSSISFSNLGVGITQIFAYSNFIRLGELDFRTLNGLNIMFNSCKKLVTIDLLKIKTDGSQTFSTTFASCISLQNIIIEGVIGQNFDIKESPLTKESITSIVNALSSSTSGKTVSFLKTAKESAFTASEWSTLIATKPNWTFSLA